MTFSTFGVIGYGHFGEFLAGSFADVGEVLVYDVEASRLPSPGRVRPGTIAEIAACGVVVLAVPFEALEAVLAELVSCLPASTVVMDVVSTKARATELLRTNLGGHGEILATHPLFGPPSMDRIRPGLKLVVTASEGTHAEEFIAFLEQELGLEIVRIDADAHDEAMAYIQALPFFIARGLVRLKILERSERELGLPSFEKLATIAEIEEHHTASMFDTSQRSNPYAERVRREFLDVLEELQRELAVEERTIDPGDR